MRVVTLHEKELAEKCRELAVMTKECRPDIIVGILTGGGEVGRLMAPYFPDATYIEVKLQRPGTQKKKALRKLLRLLPTFVTDKLRIYEAKKLSKLPAKVYNLHFDLEKRNIISSPKNHNILIIDDAVDSGSTLQSVYNSIRQAAPQANIKSAVLTVTTPSPSFQPDYALWRDGTLLRCPWSFDYNKNRK